MVSKEIISAFAILFTLMAYLPYLYKTVKGQVKPHSFTWVIWTLTTTVVFWAQYQSGGGAGSWVIFVTSLLSLAIVILAVTKNTTTITKLDWVFFLAALSALPIWYFSASPQGAVIILSIVDMLGFGPTIRKSYTNPFAENAGFFFIIMVRDILAILALETYNITTVLFPASIASSCLVVLTLITLRRYHLGNL